jgi:hypothetical protein
LLDASAALRSPKITQVIITTSINSLSNSKSSEYQTLKNCQSNAPVEQQQGFFASTLSYPISQLQPAC